LAAKGKISATTPVGQGKDGPWVPAIQVKGLLPAESASGEKAVRAGLPVDAAEPFRGKPGANEVAGATPAEAPPRPPEPPAAEPAIEAPPVSEAALAALEASNPQSGPSSGFEGEAHAQSPTQPDDDSEGDVPPVEPPVSPVALAAIEGSGPESGPSSEFHVETDAQKLGGSAGPPEGGKPTYRRRRRNQTKSLVIALSVAFVGLAAVLAVVILSSQPAATASRPPAAPKRKAPRALKKQPEGVLIPGLDEYLRGEGSAAEDEEQNQDEVQGDSVEALEAVSKTPKASEWIDASKSSAERGPMTVKLASAEIGIPRLIARATGQVARPQDEHLSLELELRNRSQTEKLEYTSWNVQDAGVGLADDRRQPLPMKSFGSRGYEIDGQLEGSKGSLNPGEVIRDVLLFEAPAERAEHLRLELPASAFGEQGSLRFEIPMSMVVRVSEPVAEDRDMRPADREPATKPREEEDGRGPIPIPGVHREEGDDEDDFTFESDPRLQKARKELWGQPQEEERAAGGGRRSKGRGNRARSGRRN
jgi:hypothetical protein